jgi:hypothetical protein
VDAASCDDIADIIAESTQHEKQHSNPKDTGSKRYLPHKTSALISFRRKSAVTLTRLHAFEQDLEAYYSSTNGKSTIPVFACVDVSGIQVLEVLRRELLFGVLCVFTDDSHSPQQDHVFAHQMQQNACLRDCPLFVMDSNSCVVSPRSAEKRLHSNTTVPQASAKSDFDGLFAGELSKLLDQTGLTNMPLDTMWDEYKDTSLDSELQVRTRMRTQRVSVWR